MPSRGESIRANLDPPAIAGGTDRNMPSPHPRIRIVRIIDRLNIGGPAKHVTWLTAGLDPELFDSVLITGTVPDGEGDMSYFAHEAGIEPIVIPEMSREIGPRDLIVIFKLLGHLWRLKPQIIHTHKAKAGAVGRVAAFLYRCLRPGQCRVVHTYHGHIFHSYYSPAKTRLFVTIERILARFATDRIITISEQQRREIGEDFRVGRPDQLQVIPLGIDLDEARPSNSSFRAELGLDQQALLIGIVGRLCEVKNHKLFLEGAAEFLKNTADSTLKPYFVIIGDGHLRAELEASARELRISLQVIFAGFRREASTLYHELDLVALTSLNEGTPLTLIEGMNCGRAVIATEVGGVVDLLGERREGHGRLTIWDHGVTVPSGDAEAFAHGIRYLIERPELRQKMGASGRQFVHSRLSKKRLINEIQELYLELLNIPQETRIETKMERVH